MQCPRCPGQDLREGGVLSSSTCLRCGGGLLADDGSQRLLEEELGHDRGQLRELAALVGGVRIPCPLCRGRMSPLQLRGAALDMCFGCGALWLDAGELEQLSGGRWKLPPAQTCDPVPVLAATRSLVRVDERPPAAALLRNALFAYGVVGLFAAVTPVAFAPGLVSTALALSGAAWLTRRRVTDVLPRARRVHRWRGVLPPPSPRPSDGDELPTDAMVVVVPHPIRALKGLRRIELVDPEGRIIVTLRRFVREREAEAVAGELARSLGLALRVDIPRHAEPLEERPAAIGDHATLVCAPEDVPGISRMRIGIRTPDGTAVATAQNQVTLDREVRSLGLLLQSLWSISSPDAPLARLLPSDRFDQRASVLLLADGTLAGHIRVERTFFYDTVEWAAPRRTRTLTVHVAHASHHGRMLDARGRVLGEMHVTRRPGKPSTVVVHYTTAAVPGATRVGVVAMALHLSLAGAMLDV